MSPTSLGILTHRAVVVKGNCRMRAHPLETIARQRDREEEEQKESRCLSALVRDSMDRIAYAAAGPTSDLDMFARRVTNVTAERSLRTGWASWRRVGT